METKARMPLGAAVFLLPLVYTLDYPVLRVTLFWLHIPAVLLAVWAISENSHNPILFPATLVFIYLFCCLLGSLMFYFTRAFGSKN